MGTANKLGLDVAGEALVRRAARVLLASQVERVVVVLGHQAELVAPLLADLPVQQVVNPAYADGQMTSVHRGLEALDVVCDGMMVVLADQALLTAADIDELIDAFAGLGAGRVLVPMYRGRRGNPAIISYCHRDAILASGPKPGCRGFIDRHPELVTAVEMANDHVVVDLDTPRDYAELRRRLDLAAAPKQETEG